MIKKIVSFFLIFSILIGLNTSFLNYHKAYAEDDDECGNDKTCRINRSRKRQEELQAQYEAARSNYQSLIALANQYAKDIENLEAEIALITPQIEDLTVRIDELEKSIETNQQLVDELEERVLTRMAEAQGTMHFNPYLDFILGANGFSDMLRRMYGIEAINSKEEADRNELADIIETLTRQKNELDEAKEDLENKRLDLELKQAEAEKMRSYYNEAAEAAEEEADNYRNQIEDEIRLQTSIEFNLEDLLQLDPLTGFSSPVPGSTISAGFPYYPASFGGGVHLGVDYAAKVGTYLYAPADGIIVVSDDNCATYGYLGNSCGGLGGGVSYGGNQIYFMCSVGGSIFALTFSHLYSGSVHEKGIVTQGTPIARVGSSGNSTGPHCHIEMFYLGPGDNEDLITYVDKLRHGDYSLSFNCGWGSAGLYTTCDNKGAPCRLNGANYLPH